MITAKISAGSSSIVQDIIDMCQNLHQPLSDWQGFFYKSTTGSQQWCVWAMRMDEQAHELQYVHSTGLGSPPDGYELITVSCPTTTGFSLSFTQVNAMPSITQTRDGGDNSTRVNAQGYPTMTFRLSAQPSTNLTDFMTVFNNFRPAGTLGGVSVAKYFYKSSGGSQPWAVYGLIQTFQYTAQSAPTPVVMLYIMSGVASPPAGSEQLAIACPSTTTLATDGFSQLGGPLVLG